MPPIATLLTDFGLDDYYVAAVKGVILARAPEATLVDVGHGVAPGDVEGGSFLLAAAMPAFPDGTVHLAVVDPGVGSERRLLVVDTGAARLVAPDNGLLTPWLDAGRAFAVCREDLFRPAPGRTFHGRDRFAPVVAALLTGSAPAALGAPIDDAVRLDVPPPRRGERALDGRVAHVDRFGNLVTDLPAHWLGERRWRVEVNGHHTDLRVGCYAELGERAGWLIGSLGTLELSLDGASLARRWGVTRGMPVRATPDSAPQGDRISLTGFPPCVKNDR